MLTNFNKITNYWSKNEINNILCCPLVKCKLDIILFVNKSTVLDHSQIMNCLNSGQNKNKNKKVYQNSKLTLHIIMVIKINIQCIIIRRPTRPYDSQNSVFAFNKVKIRHRTDDLKVEKYSGVRCTVFGTLRN